jgi:hypothetical protein
MFPRSGSQRVSGFQSPTLDAATPIDPAAAVFPRAPFAAFEGFRVPAALLPAAGSAPVADGVQG